MRKCLVLFLLCPLVSLSQPLTTSVVTVGNLVTSSAQFNLNSKLGEKAALIKNKPVLLCFFASWCSTCLKELPKLVAAQQVYGNRFQVVLVTYENDAQWKAAQAKRPFYAKLSLPVITADTTLQQTFPYKYVPHTVWIGRDGTVQAITGAEELTAANFDAFANGASLRQLAVKKDVMEDSRGPLLQDTLAMYQSAIGRYLPGRGTSVGQVSVKGGNRWFWCNEPVLTLYSYATGIPSNRWLLEGLDEKLYYIPDSVTRKWKETALYTYELTLPQTVSAAQRKTFMWQDLNRYLGLWGRIEKRKRPCWVLQRTDTTSLQTGSGKVGLWVNKDSQTIVLQNLPLGRFVAAFAGSSTVAKPLPLVLDETNFSAPVNLTLAGNLSDPASFNSSLASYGLRLFATQREVDVLVLSPAVNNPETHLTKAP